MNIRQGNFISPIVLFLTAIVMFELCLRLPYVLYVLSSPQLGYLSWMHFFSYHDPSSVVFVGLTVLLTTAAICYFFAMRIGMTYDTRTIIMPDFHIPPIIYPIALVFIGAAFMSIMLLGVTNVAENLSGKRSEAGESFAIYAAIKAANFCHVIAIIFYVKINQNGRLIDRLFFVMATIALVLPTIVFSQRAILIGFTLELLYIQMVFRTFNMRGVVRIALAIIPVLLLISLLRPSDTVGDISFFEAVMASLEKVVSSRYFFDLSKLGSVILWYMETPWLGPIAINFLIEPFFPDSVLFYKEIGPILSDEVYHYRTVNGVTPGALLEGILSFGILGGIIFFGVAFGLFLKVERKLLTSRRHLGTFWFFLMLMILSKFGLLVNSSLGAFTFQIILETGFLVAVFSVIGAWNMLARSGSRVY